MPAPLPKGVTLRGLEVFESLARTGSVAATATELGLSAPAVSQQMKNLPRRWEPSFWTTRAGR
jgi:hypothetical protein